VFAPLGSPPAVGAQSRPSAEQVGIAARALLIDAMGTLVSLCAPAPLLRSELRTRFGVAVSETQAQRAIRAEIRFYRAHMREGRDAAALARLRHGCAEAMRAAVAGSAMADMAADDLVTALLASLRFCAYPDAPDALRRARAAGWRIVVVSNWDVSLTEVLERVGLAPLLDGVVTSAAVGKGKPDPGIFSHALAIAGVSADEALHVGDTIAEDVRGAQAGGIRVVLVNRHGAEPPAIPGVPIIGSLDELGMKAAQIRASA
jgi:putative hydrolase of the HAD superfamily